MKEEGCDSVTLAILEARISMLRCLVSKGNPVNKETKYDLLHDYGKHAFQGVDKSIELAHVIHCLDAFLRAVRDRPRDTYQGQAGKSYFRALRQVPEKPTTLRHFSTPSLCFREYPKEEEGRDDFNNRKGDEVPDVKMLNEIWGLLVLVARNGNDDAKYQY